MKIFKLIAAAVMATVLGAGVASAATFGSIPGGTAKNDALIPLGFAPPGTVNPSLDGFFGAQIWVSGSGPLTVTATLMGAEAGFKNSFRLGSGPANTLTDASGGNHFDPLGVTAVEGYKSVTRSVTAGLLDFSFSTFGNGGSTVTNGTNPGPVGNGINFFASFGNAPGDQTNSGSVLWLFFDDDGAGPDDNHDDLVIKLSIAGLPGGGPGLNAVPVPAAGFLLFGALGGLAAMRRRKKKTS